MLEKTVHALIVDDSKPVRSILTKVLNGLQFQCVEASNGIEALDRLSHMPRPSLITLNRHMPEMDGFELLGRIRRSPQFRNLPVVMISTDSNEASVEAAMRLGANDFVAKPFTPSELTEHLNALGLITKPDQKNKKSLTPPPRPNVSKNDHPNDNSTKKSIQLLLVDDSAVIRGILTKTLRGLPGIEVTGTAANGEKALDFLEKTRVDVVLLDIEMPVMDGLETLRHLRKQYPKLPVVMFSSLTERGAKATLEALVAGANDYVAKPSVTDTDSIVKKIESELVPKVKAVYRPPQIAENSAQKTILHKSTYRTNSAKKSHKISVIVIAVSTGGPSALVEILPHITVAHAPPVVIVQHMPKEFTGHLATRLSKMCDQKVSEAKNGEPLLSEHIYMAPGGVHLEIQKHGHEFILALHDGPPENSCRPSADVLFRSASRLFGSDVLALVLTGMGSDGLEGSKAIASAGGTVIAQDEPSSVVWGMPGQVVRAGIADATTPLDCIGPDVARRIYRQKS